MPIVSPAVNANAMAQTMYNTTKPISTEIPKMDHNAIVDKAVENMGQNPATCPIGGCLKSTIGALEKHNPTAATHEALKVHQKMGTGLLTYDMAHKAVMEMKSSDPTFSGEVYTIDEVKKMMQEHRVQPSTTFNEFDMYYAMNHIANKYMSKDIQDVDKTVFIMAQKFLNDPSMPPNVGSASFTHLLNQAKMEKEAVAMEDHKQSMMPQHTYPTIPRR